VDFSSLRHSEMSKMSKKNGRTMAKNGQKRSISSVYGGILRKTEAVATLLVALLLVPLPSDGGRQQLDIQVKGLGRTNRRYTNLV
jgi:hypothetical protein